MLVSLLTGEARVKTVSIVVTVTYSACYNLRPMGREYRQTSDMAASLTATMRSRRAMRMTIFGLLTNAVLAMVKLVTGLLGGSCALIADAVESFADIFTSLVVWSSLRVSSMPADEKHPYGHGKAEALAGLGISVMLFGAALGIAVQAIQQIQSHKSSPEPYALWILLFVIAVKEGLFRYVRRAAVAIESSVLMADAWHHRGDAITSLAAAAGISIAVIGGDRFAAADAWAALLAAAVIVVNACRLLMPPLHELMDAEPPEVIDKVRKIAESVQGVTAVEKVFARKSGAGYWVDMHIEVDPAMRVDMAHSVSHNAKDLILERLPAIRDVLIHVEPFLCSDTALSSPKHANHSQESDLP